MAFNDALDTINSRGGDWVNLKETGDTVTVTLTHAESRDKTFDGAVVLSQKTGKPRTEVVISGTTADGSSIKCALDEGAQSAVKKAMALGNAPFAPGSKLTVKVSGKFKTDPKARYELKQYEAVLEPGSFSAIQAETPASDFV